MVNRNNLLDQRVESISHSPSGLSDESKAKCGQRKRWDEREQIFKPAKVYTGRGAYIRCIVLNVNAKGARVALDGSFDLPETVVLKFDQTKEAHTARVVWRDRNEYGLSYRIMRWQKPPVI